MMNISGCLAFLSSKPDYLNWLRDFRYDPSQVTVTNDNGKLNIRLTGPWREAIMWEVPLLAVISELVIATVHRKRASIRRWPRWKKLATSPPDRWAGHVRFRLMDFGTRRRFSRDSAGHR
jgi:nicotinate phosphoribosyltransferase